MNAAARFEPRLISYLSGKKWFILFLAAFLYCAIIALSARRQFGGNLSGFLFAGPLARCSEVYYSGLTVRDDSGYDGQYFYFIAVDPFVRMPSLYACTRTESYRYQRILFPFLSSLVALGKKERLPAAMLGVNLFGILLGVYFLALMCQSTGAHPGFSLIYAFSAGNLIGLTRSTCEPLYLASLIAAFYFSQVRRNLLLAALALCFGAAAKELALVTAGVLLIYEWIGRRNFKGSLILFMPFALFFLWQLRINALFADLPFQVTHARSEAVGRSLMNVFSYYYSRLEAVSPASILSWVDVPLFAGVIICLAALARKLKRFDSPYPWIGIIFGLLVAAFSFPPNGTDFWGYGRHSAEIFLCAFLLFISTREKIYLLPLGLNFFSFLLIAAALI